MVSFFSDATFPFGDIAFQIYLIPEFVNRNIAYYKLELPRDFINAPSSLIIALPQTLHHNGSPQTKHSISEINLNCFLHPFKLAVESQTDLSPFASNGLVSHSETAARCPEDRDADSTVETAAASSLAQALFSQPWYF